MMRVPKRCGGVAGALLSGALIFTAPLLLAAEISPGDREAVFEGAGQACNQQMPEAIRQRAGAAAVLNFCSCYAGEVARTITEEQVDALADESRPLDAIPHYGETMRNAWRACEKQLLAKETAASWRPRER